jgi:hypothetical protein
VDTSKIIAAIDEKIASLTSARDVLLDLHRSRAVAKLKQGRPKGSKDKAKKRAGTPPAAKTTTAKNTANPAK